MEEARLIPRYLMRIFLVEDERKIALFVKAGLEFENFLVDIANDGEEAIARFKKGLYDLVLLDLMMPGKNGFETCLAIKKADKDIPVIMVSARDSAQVIQDAYEIGVDDYIVKPFRLDELIAKIKSFAKK